MEKLGDKILEFIQNRDKKEESTASRNIHIRFGNEVEEIEQILTNLLQKNKISKFYDKQYQEYRYTAKKVVEE